MHFVLCTYLYVCSYYYFAEQQPSLYSKPKMEQQSTLISVTSLDADFASLLLSICKILSDSPNRQDNLKICKDYCSLLRVSESSSESLFSAEKISKIKKCKNFKDLFTTVSQHIRWDEHSILTHIVNECKSDEAQQEIEKFDKKMELFQGLQIISNTSNQNLSKDFVKFCVVINKPYKNVTTEEYKSVKAYISDNLKINAYATAGFVTIFYHSLHIEWLVTIQAVPHMIKAAHQNKDNFIKENFVFMQIGSEIVIEDEVPVFQFL